MKLKFASVALMALCLFAADAAEEPVKSVGYGKSYREAVNEALVSALQQKTGVAITAEEKSSLVSSQKAESLNDEHMTKSQIEDSVKSAFNTVASGKILRYTVDEDGTSYDKDSGVYKVSVTAYFPGGYKAPGRPEGNLRRMAVSVFRVETGDSYSWYGTAESSAAWVKTLAAKLNERLAQTRKFSMVDRAFDEEVDAELARLTGPNASAEDAERLGRKLGTDYLVVGTVKLRPVQSPGENPLTGQPLEPFSQVFAEVSYRVLVAPTGQLKWADTVTVDALDCPAVDIASFASLSADAASQEIADSLMDNILPLEIVGKTSSGLLVIGEGGKSLAPGEMFTVYALGEKVRDTRTGEVLDRLEEAVGEIKIVEVKSKLSYAEIVGGDADKMVPGARLRRPVTSGAEEQAAPALSPAPTIQVSPSGGVVFPF
ncbi:MAG: CsgG/HfaB family protein [Kiritimatiellae bacterium]|nr:CsgG/HfaB family protein [Kiritimatiellia bacterium]